ncbi:hypothetical protein Y032_0019g3757 [Ancylostoma ceylanicum]|uniref:Serpentine receptor class gamma n=2 Tax=Ancylostoma ceylanicum TaxID=53326 RepID=A0A016V2S7_9BILA|nr:hypothetical protein Y032_0019g3757 [Ancylostoma ceylanicum]
MIDLSFIVADTLFIASVATIIFYSYVLFVMAFSKTKAFSSTFFRTFIFTGFFDILAIVALEWTRADYLLGFGHQFELGTRLMMAFTGTNFLIHVFGEVLMTLNRYTAACKPMIHQKLWEKVRMKYLYFASVVLSFVAYTEWFLTKCVYEHTVDGWKLIGREEQTLNLILLTAITCPVNLMQSLYDLSVAFNLRNPVVLWIQSQTATSTSWFESSHGFGDEDSAPNYHL